jgi:ABC-type multidrug transport system ATPase subunit
MTSPTVPPTPAAPAVDRGGVQIPVDWLPPSRDGPNAPLVTARCPVLRASGITKSYRRGVWPRRGYLAVLRGVELELCGGEIVGLVGENGSGKSTLMKILVGALDADAGKVEVGGRVGYCPQEPLLYERLTCDEHLELFGVAYQMTPQVAAASADALYDTLGFGQWRDRQVGELSGGTRAKLNLALALLADPDLLLLDEPYAGFDWDTYQRFWDVTAQRRAAGRSVLVVSHFVTDQQRFDRLVEMRDGKSVAR